jgi:glycosyltransferase involved in cell wall biosynthesis
MKILFIAEIYPPSVNGTAYATEQMVLHLAARGHKLIVVAPSDSIEVKQEIKGNVNMIYFPAILLQKKQLFRASPNFLHRRLIQQILRLEKPDIIHVNSPGWVSQTTIPLAKKLAIPVVGTSHILPQNFVHYFKLPKKIEPIITKGVWKWFTGFYNKLLIVIAPTQFAAEILLRQEVTTKIVVISNGIDLSRFKKPISSKNRSSNGIKTILSIGRLDKEKNIDVLLRAIALLKNRKDFSMIIGGKGEQEEHLKHLAQKLHIAHRVIFLGYLSRENLLKMYQRADIFITPGDAELQSLVTMEAMASGLPVIGANAAALPLLIHDKHNGLLYPPHNVTALAVSISNLLDDKNLREKMGENSLEIIANHDIQKVTGQLEHLYETLLQPRK